MIDMMDIIADALKDSVNLLPFLFLTYLFMEYVESRAMTGVTKTVARVGAWGPLFGGVTGIVPQCGFSAAAAGLFSGGVISLGTLLAVFLATSDEMLPLFISHGLEMGTMVKIIGVKIGIAIVSGFIVDALVMALKKKRTKTIHDFCESEDCEEEDGIFLAAAKHTVKIWLFILVVNLALNFLLETTGFEAMMQTISVNHWLSVPVICLVGLIPNCAASVVITELYLNQLITGGAMMAGLLVSCGVGLLVLFRADHNMKESIKITGIMYGLGVFWGLLIEILGIVF
ncbi:MAG: putative manganese transporter [Lachnospiraceae bacterium]|nr:putative manganese transporter [Lachnospiraceae bacterium]